MVKQGGPSGKEEMQVIAMIAYLQRLGTDITRPDVVDEKTGAVQ